MFKIRKIFVALLVLCSTVSAASTVDLGSLIQDIEFSRRRKLDNVYSDHGENVELREEGNFYAPENQTVVRSLSNYDPTTLFPHDTVFTVVIAHLVPWVKIDDLDSDVDPGNINQTRTYNGGQISGLLIDYLERLAYEMYVTFEYVYPCKKIDIELKGSCGVNSWVHSLQVLKGNESYYTPAQKCTESDSHCFAANVQINFDNFVKFQLTQPVLNEGWKVVVATQGNSIDFMSWLDPFDWTLWIVVLAEIFTASLILALTEGYGTNENLWMDNIFSTCYDSFYWSFTCLFGAMNQAPSTWAGRTIYVCQLFFGQLLIALYVGNLVTFLGEVSYKTPITRVEDLFDVTSENYNPSNSICIPTEHPSINTYLQQQSELFPKARFGIVRLATLDDCLMHIYLGKATATFYQKGVLHTKLQEFASMGKCSSNGGYCTNPTGPQQDLIRAEDCICPSVLKLVDGSCQNPKKNVWNPVSVDLVTVGDLFNMNGFCLAFPNADGQSAKFSEAIQWSKDTGILESLINQVPSMSAIYNSCNAFFPLEIAQMDFVNLEGLFIITMIAVFIGVTIGLWEVPVFAITIIDLSLRYCPCFKSFRDRHGEVDPEDPEPSKGKGMVRKTIEAAGDDDGTPGGPDADIDARIAALQARIAELGEILDEVARS